MKSEIDVMFRVIWNTNGWRAPSGGFLEADYTWGSQQGFGHEEWNFQIKDNVDGYVYAYVYPRPARVADRISKFRAVFYSISPEGEWFLVGEYAEAEVSQEDDPARVDEYFEKNGIYDERTEQLISITSDRVDFLGQDFTKLSLAKRRRIIRKELKDSIRAGYYILKCPVDKVIAYPGAIPVDNELLEQLRRRGTQYIRPFYPSSNVRMPSPETSRKSKKDVHLDEGSYWRLPTGERRRIWKKHNNLSNDFSDWLKNQGYTDIIREENSVDIEFKSNKILCRSELKICGGGKPLWSIREAIGQLLQYNLYGNRATAEQWFIILDEKPLQWDFDFMETLRSTYNLPIWLGWQSNDTFEMEKIP